MVEVNWTSGALDDIEDIAKFISQDSEDYASIQTNRFFERVEILQTQPLIGRRVPEVNDNLIRELITENYRIIYKVVSDRQVDILTIHHGARLLINNPAFKRNKIEILSPKKRTDRKRRKNR